MTQLFYILEDQEVVPANDIFTWMRWWENNDRRLAYEEIGQASVSTVFLGINHSLADGTPQFFETALFLGGHIHQVVRSATYQKAMEEHRHMVGQLVCRSN